MNRIKVLKLVNLNDSELLTLSNIISFHDTISIQKGPKYKNCYNYPIYLKILNLLT